MRFQAKRVFDGLDSRAVKAQSIKNKFGTLQLVIQIIPIKVAPLKCIYAKSIIWHFICIVITIFQLLVTY